MRYYLDTQTLAQYILQRGAEAAAIRLIFEDYGNLFYTSSVCVKELVHLIQAGRIRPAGRNRQYNAYEVIQNIIRAGVEIIPPNVLHLQQMSHLPYFDEHNDPNDRLIIAQAIADRVPLISTDLQFERYIPYGLELIRNR